MTIADLLGCGSRTNTREKDDFYATPEGATVALLKYESAIPSVIWEPCCGDGAIANVLKRQGRQVICTDLVDRGAGESRIDFLMERQPHAFAVVSNPPFKLARQFILHAQDIGVLYMALLLKSDFFNSEKSRKVFDQWRPARKYALSWRLDFTGEGAGPMNYDWFVWDGVSPTTSYDVIPKPKA